MAVIPSESGCSSWSPIGAMASSSEEEPQGGDSTSPESLMRPPPYECQEGTLEYAYIRDLSFDADEMPSFEWKLLYRPTCARYLAGCVLGSSHMNHVAVRGVEQRQAIFMNVSGKHMSTYKYEFQSFSEMGYKFSGAWRVWKYKCKRKEWKDVVVRPVGRPLFLSYKTVHDQAQGASIAVFFYAFTGRWFRAIRCGYKERCTNRQVIKRLRETMARSGLMSPHQQIYWWDSRHMQSLFDWDSYPVEADDLRR